jgi:hypothetical protein
MAKLTPQQVVDLWRQYTTDIPWQYALGSAQHESDLEPGPGADTSGDQPKLSDSTSYGLYQMSTFEQGLAVVIGDIHDPDVNTKIFYLTMSKKLGAIRAAAGFDDHGSDVWAYLGMAHNMGLGSALKTIAQHGLDWQAYKDRNPDLPFVSKGYGDDCISGGKYADQVSISDTVTDADGNTIAAGSENANTAWIVKLVLIAGGGYILWNLANGREPLAGIGV